MVKIIQDRLDEIIRVYFSLNRGLGFGSDLRNTTTLKLLKESFTDSHGFNGFERLCLCSCG